MTTDRDREHVASVQLARKELEDSAHPRGARDVFRGPDGWNVRSVHPLLGITDLWMNFETEHEAQAFADGLTIHDDLEDHERILDLDTDLADVLDGDVGIAAYIDPDTLNDYSMGAL